MTARLRAFAAFCYDFVIGDDWRVAVAVVAGLAVTWAVSTTTVPAWWIAPVAVAVLLPYSLRRVVPRRRPPTG
jgi:tryptophan-rich sensory protein